MTTHTIPNDAETRFRQDLARVVSTGSGIAVLQELMNQCGYQKPSCVANPQIGELNPLATTYNEGRRNLWLWLRKYIAHDKLIMIELAEPPPEDDLAGV